MLLPVRREDSHRSASIPEKPCRADRKAFRVWQLRLGESGLRTPVRAPLPGLAVPLSIDSGPARKWRTASATAPVVVKSRPRPRQPFVPLLLSDDSWRQVARAVRKESALDHPPLQVAQAQQRGLKAILQTARRERWRAVFL